MDNFHVDVTSEGDEALLRVLQLAFLQHRHATHWREEVAPGQGGPPSNLHTMRFLLAWADPGEGWHPFPVPIGAEQAQDVVLGWLAATKYPPQPDHDGDNGKGWGAYCNLWGFVDPDYRYAFLAVEPVWAMYGK